MRMRSFAGHRFLLGSCPPVFALADLYRPLVGVGFGNVPGHASRYVPFGSSAWKCTSSLDQRSELWTTEVAYQPVRSI